MRQIMIVSLDARTFHVDEDAYHALRRYLDRVRVGLRNDPDVNEVLGDFERSIADKCAGVVQSGKNVIGADDMHRVLEEMGPVNDVQEAFDEPPIGATRASASGARKLCKQPNGAKLSGVCSGLAEYFGTDPVIIRIAFIILSFFAGLGVLAYLVLEGLMPSPAGAPAPRFRLLRGTLFVAALFLLFLIASSTMPGMRFRPPGIFGLRFAELFLLPIMLGIYLLPVLVIALIVVVAVRFVRSNPRQ